MSPYSATKLNIHSTFIAEVWVFLNASYETQMTKNN